MALRGFKTKIAFNIALLLLLSAIFTDVLAILFAQNWIARREILHRKNVLEHIVQGFFHFEVEEPSFDGRARLTLYRMLQTAGVDAVSIASNSQELYFRFNSLSEHRELHRKAVKEALQAQKLVQHNLSGERSLFTRMPHDVLIAFTLDGPGQYSTTISAEIPLSPIYKSIRDFNRPILFYIALNTLVLTAIGLYRIFRIYLRPIDRIIRQADDFREDEELFFSFRREDNELNRLSSALNRMLKRITSDRLTLKEAVASLEKANKDLLKAQGDIIKAEKLASVGRLAAGIAHEIGNPIGIIIGYLDLLARQNITEDQKHDYLQRAEMEIQRINRIIRQLLDLARSKEQKTEIIDVHQVIDETIDVMRFQPIMKGIHIESTLDNGEQCVSGNSDQLRQVLLNLIINSADAIRSIPDKCDGRIRFSTFVEESEAQAKRWISILCTDNGPGIPAACMEYLFDPFYTSKEPGKGTGLGLAVSFMIVEKMGGTIKALNEPQGGTSMVIRIPLACRRAEDLPDESNPQRE